MHEKGGGTGSHCRIPAETWDTSLQFQNQKAFVIRLSSHYKDIKIWEILLSLFS